MIRKLLITPWFGTLPLWWPLYMRNFEERLRPQGYDLLLVEDLPEFKKLVRDKLGIDCPVVAGEGKVHDYRCTFGVLFEEELRGYDFWGHTDFDVVYGRVERYVTDEFLDGLDIHSNHVDYMSGPWSLYRNTPAVNSIFAAVPGWEDVLQNETTTGWVETRFTERVDWLHERGMLRREYTMWQTRNLDDFSSVRFDGPALMEGDDEVMMAHFRRTKVYPAGCVV